MTTRMESWWSGRWLGVARLQWPLLDRGQTGVIDLGSLRVRAGSISAPCAGPNGERLWVRLHLAPVPATRWRVALRTLGPQLRHGPWSPQLEAELGAQGIDVFAHGVRGECSACGARGHGCPHVWALATIFGRLVAADPQAFLRFRGWGSAPRLLRPAGPGLHHLLVTNERAWTPRSVPPLPPAPLDVADLPLRLIPPEAWPREIDLQALMATVCHTLGRARTRRATARAGAASHRPKSGPVGQRGPGATASANRGRHHAPSGAAARGPQPPAHAR